MAFFKRSRFKKYNNTRVKKGGFSFASKGESALHDELLIMEKAGLIYDIRCQDTVYLSHARIKYIPDFSYIDAETHQREYAEFKGLETDVWKVKKKLYKKYGPGKLKIFKGRYDAIYLDEEVIPKKENESANDLLQAYFDRTHLPDLIGIVPVTLYQLLQEIREKLSKDDDL